MDKQKTAADLSGFSCVSKIYTCKQRVCRLIHCVGVREEWPYWSELTFGECVVIQIITLYSHCEQKSNPICPDWVNVPIGNPNPNPVRLLFLADRSESQSHTHQDLMCVLSCFMIWTLGEWLDLNVHDLMQCTVWLIRQQQKWESVHVSLMKRPQSITMLDYPMSPCL